MNIEKCKRARDDKRRNVTISISTTQARSKWLKDNDLSPTKVFNQALEDLGFKAEKEALK